MIISRATPTGGAAAARRRGGNAAAARRRGGNAARRRRGGTATAARTARRCGGVNGADLLQLSINELSHDIRLTPFAARKVGAARDEFLRGL